MPEWKNIVVEIKNSWEQEQLKEFAFSAITKEQNEQNKKLKLGI